MTRDIVAVDITPPHRNQHNGLRHLRVNFYLKSFENGTRGLFSSTIARKIVETTTQLPKNPKGWKAGKPGPYSQPFIFF